MKRTQRAEEDLLEVWVHIARDNPAAADAVLDGFDERSRWLMQYPELDRRRPDIAEGVRSIRFGEFLILYRANDKSVEIVRYVHGRRNLNEIL